MNTNWTQDNCFGEEGEGGKLINNQTGNHVDARHN